MPILAASGGLLLASQATPQESTYRAQPQPPAARAAQTRILQGPELESASDSSAIIRWTSNNPGGSDEHYAVIHYGTTPQTLDRTAISHIRLNRTHAETVFRVYVPDLKPHTTYYYTVDSIQANGASDGLHCSVAEFKTPRPGERVAAR